MVSILLSMFVGVQVLASSLEQEVPGKVFFGLIDCHLSVEKKGDEYILGFNFENNKNEVFVNADEFEESLFEDGVFVLKKGDRLNGPYNSVVIYFDAREGSYKKYEFYQKDFRFKHGIQHHKCHLKD